jgi:hypothetical protein
VGRMRFPGAALLVLSGLSMGSAALAPQAVANPYIGPDDAQVQSFRSPSGNIHCEINFQRGSGVPDGAYCMSVQPLQNVLIRSDGSLANVCTNDPSCGSNAPLDEAVLPYGQSAVLGPFTCLSEESGMTCTANGRGFTISSAGIAPV